MKLIDLLVQELPRRGGWPHGNGCITCNDVSGKVFGHGRLLFITDKKITSYEGGIKKEQYEAALTASKQVEWNEGIPPVSTECEIFDCEKWLPVRIKYVGDYLVVVKELDGSLSERVFHIAKHPDKFRPIRTEAEPKRDECSAMIEDLFYTEGSDGNYLRGAGVYDAIAAGKIPGIKLAD